jgi:membrane protein CcdC involved in cytochrome C biogenesis
MLIAPITSAVGAVLGLFAVLLWRLREGRRPVTMKTIVIPPLGMATGFSMFFVPMFRIPWFWALGAFLAGSLLLSYPLIRTSRLVLEGETVMMRRSKIFFGVVLVLAAVRYFARDYIGHIITMQQTAGLFFILAFGMVLTWRASMYFEYKRLFRRPSQPAVSEMWPER